ncbi:MAG: oligoendopeptidase F, partial [Ruminococcus sp.]|nr:oligoendopeptidase F [Ruminococcus sp.]
MSEKRIPKRSEQKKEYTWAIEDIYASDELWKADLERLKSLVDKIAGFKGRLDESGKTLYEYFTLFFDETVILCNSLSTYAQRKSDEDTTNSTYQAMTGQIMNVYVAINSASSFQDSELIAIPDEKLEQFYKETPELELYKTHINRVRKQKEHILSEAEEKILALSGELAQSPENIYSLFNDADLKFPDAVDKDGNKHQLTHGSYIPLVKSNDRELRRSAFEQLYHTYDSFKNTCAATLSAQAKMLSFYAKARKYNSTLEAALSETD